MIWVLVAWRNVIRNARRSIFSILITTVGGVAVMLAVGYMAASFEAVREGTIHGGLGHLQIATDQEFDGYADFPLQHGLEPATVERIHRSVLESDPAAVVLPRVAFQGIASTGDRSLVFLGEGVMPSGERSLNASYVQLSQGVGLEAAPEKTYRAVVGQELARLLGIRVGDSLTLMAPTSAAGLNAMDVEVVGLIKTGILDVDRTRLLLPVALAQELIRTDKVSRVAIGLAETAHTDVVGKSLGASLSDMRVRSWSELSPFYHQLVDLYVRQFIVLGFIIAAVVVLAMTNTVLMSVFERTREVGTLAALGISRSRIRLQFVLEGFFLGTLGGACAVVGAYALANAVNLAGIEMPAPPGQTDGYRLFIAFIPEAASWTLAVAAVLGIVSAFAASRRISNLDPVKSLQHA